MELLSRYFGNMIVKKDAALEQFSSLSIPSFIRDWFIRRYADSEGNIDPAFVASRIKEILPRKDDFNGILDRLIGGETVKFMAKIKINIDIATSFVSFELPDLGVTGKDTFVEPQIWKEIKDNFLDYSGAVWGIGEFYYAATQIGKKTEGKIKLKCFKSFCPYKIDLEYYKKAAAHFELSEWIDVLLGAIDYNADGFESEEQKLFMLRRLLPFVEKRLNLIELAPKGTGKSYLFSQISRRGWLSSGGVMTRAKMFYDMHLKTEGLVMNYDFVALDEIATIKFPDSAEMQGAMKGFLESGRYSVGAKSGSGDAGVVLLGNIAKDKMDVCENMFDQLPEVFRESALIDRFHGFIEGWKIPRMNESRKVRGWALNCEYFAEIMHQLRSDISYRAIVDELVLVARGADTRDVTAVKRLTTAFMKLLFPYYTNADEVNKELFDKYCLAPALSMRGIIRKQLAILDKEYSETMPEFGIKGYRE